MWLLLKSQADFQALKFVFRFTAKLFRFSSDALSCFLLTQPAPWNSTPSHDGWVPAPDKKFSTGTDCFFPNIVNKKGTQGM
jgi:hypothetical protein